VLSASRVGQATFLDTDLQPSTAYYYRVTPLPGRWMGRRRKEAHSTAAGRPRASERLTDTQEGAEKKAWASACKAAGFPVGRRAGGYVFHRCTAGACPPPGEPL